MIFEKNVKFFRGTGYRRNYLRNNCFHNKIKIIVNRDSLDEVTPKQYLYCTSGRNERERNVLFTDTLNTFYLWLYGVRHMVKDHSDSEKGKPATAT